MKITVKIAVNDYGVLEARVIQDGQKGENLLSRAGAPSVTSARIKCQQKLRGCEIEWAGLTPDDDLLRIEDRPQWNNKRDSYGWKSL